MEVCESVSNASNIQKRARSLETAPQFDGFSKVVISVSEDVQYEAGTETGRTLTLESPWATQKIAEDILAKVRGFQYQPYDASGALLDPAAELGDGVTVSGIYSGIYSQSLTFGPGYCADIAAPSDEEIDHEYPYVPPKDRAVARSFRNVKSELNIQAGLIVAEVEERKSDVETLNSLLEIQAGEISAKVSKTGGSSQSFGWKLLDDSWTVDANGKTVFQITKDGAEVKGTIIAVEGFIGDLEIKDGSISYNNQTWGGTNSKGLYVGPSGIQLGNKFSVDDRGYLRAENGEFNGWVRAGRIDYGGDAGYFDGSGLANGSVYGGSGGKIGGGSISTFNTTGGINTSLGYADWSRGCLNGSNTAPNVKADVLTVDGNFFYKGNLIRKNTATVTTPSGPKTLNYLSWG